MSITPVVLAQSSEPEAHDKVLDNNYESEAKCKAFHMKISFENDILF